MSAEKSLKILLVDDEEIIQTTIGMFLRQCGHHVDTEVDGISAVEAIERGSYDVALVDVRIPGMDGLAVLDRAHELRPELAVVIITGHGDAHMAEDVKRRGGAGFLLKPFRLRELEAQIRAMAGGT